MKKLLITGAMLALSASVALAAGTRIQWDDCGGGDIKTSTCLSNLEALKSLHGTFNLPVDATVVGNQITLDATDPTGAPLTCWWNMTSANAPRAAGFDMAFNTPGVNCIDYWGSIPGGPSGGAAATANGNRLRISGVVAVSELGAQPVPADLEIYSFTWRLRFSNTTTCAGCLTQMQLNLQDITVTQPTGGGPNISMLPDPTDATPCAKFQGTSSACNGQTAAKNSTWGQVKALYR